MATFTAKRKIVKEAGKVRDARFRPLQGLGLQRRRRNAGPPRAGQRATLGARLSSRRPRRCSLRAAQPRRSGAAVCPHPVRTRLTRLLAPRARQAPDEFEESVAQALFDLEATNNELKADLRDLFINSAKEVDIASGRKAIVIQVPFRLLKAFHKVQQRLVRELEKKFSGKDVVIVANRRIMPKPTTGAALARPRSRTLTAGASPWPQRARASAHARALPGLAAHALRGQG